MRWLLLIVGVLLLSACDAQAVAPLAALTPTPDSCTAEALATYGAAMRAAIENYQEQAELVATVSRVSIATPLQRLLDLQNETEKINVPPCVENHKARVIAAMSNHQSKFQDFAAQRIDDALVAAGLLVAKTQLETAAGELKAISAGTPPATPEVLAEPEPVVVGAFTILSPIAGGGSGNVGAVCPADSLEIIARQDIANTVWVQVRVVKIGEADPTCDAVTTGMRADVDDEGWINDNAVFAP